MIEFHYIKPPHWVEVLIELVHGSMRASVPLHLGFSLHTSQKESDLIVFPLPGVVDGGREDGSRVTPLFELDVAKVSSAFNSLNDLGWRTTCEYNAEGSEFRISGLYQNRPVLLRVLTDPPPSAPPYVSVDGDTGEVRPKQQNLNDQ
jgi:hypothetical protein